MNSVEKPLLPAESLRPGDLLLCYSKELKGQNEEMKSGYTHVAIQGADSGIVESDSPGVRRTDVESLLQRYDHIAVLRASDTWSPRRVELLDEFLKAQCGKPFNTVGMYKVPKRKEALLAESMERVAGYFEGTEDPPPYERNQYFCSELVTAAFIRADIIDESASLILSPDVFSPEGLAADKCFGFFIGYLVPYEEYQIPTDDHFQTEI